MRRAAALVALASLVTATAACKDDDKPSTFRTTTTASTTTTTTSAVSTSSTTAAPTAPTATTRGAAAAPAPGGCDASALTRVEPRKDRTRYEITADYAPTANLVSGEMLADFTPDRDSDRVYMRLWPNGPDSVRHGGKIELADASVDGERLPLALANPTTAYVDRRVTAGKQIKFRVQFRITLPVGSDDRLSRQGELVRLGSWLPLLPWEPGVGWALDPPTTAFAEASLSVHANFSVRLRVPAGLEVLASGAATGPDQWRIESAPDFAAVIGTFRRVEGMAGSVPVTVGIDTAMSGAAEPYLAKVIASLNDHARRYGAYPWPRYTLVLTPGMRGGIEYPGLVMQGPNTNARTTPHEVSHQWFYGLVGSNQGRDPWLDEGLATWGEAMIDGTYASFKTRPVPADGRNRLGESMTYWESHQRSYYRSVYVQGLQALGALGVSTAAVDCALARYVAANAHRVATPATLTDALETVAPDAAAVLARYGAQRVT